MNQLINDIFGDSSITLDCESGECLHYSQVPGYNPPPKRDNSSMVALSAALAVAVFLGMVISEFSAIDRLQQANKSSALVREPHKRPW